MTDEKRREQHLSNPLSATSAIPNNLIHNFLTAGQSSFPATPGWCQHPSGSNAEGQCHRTHHQYEHLTAANLLRKRKRTCRHAAGGALKAIDLRYDRTRFRQPQPQVRSTASAENSAPCPSRDRASQDTNPRAFSTLRIGQQIE